MARLWNRERRVRVQVCRQGRFSFFLLLLYFTEPFCCIHIHSGFFLYTYVNCVLYMYLDCNIMMEMNSIEPRLLLTNLKSKKIIEDLLTCSKCLLVFKISKKDAEKKGLHAGRKSPHDSEMLEIFKRRRIMIMVVVH